MYHKLFVLLTAFLILVSCRGEPEAVSARPSDPQAYYNQNSTGQREVPGQTVSKEHSQQVSEKPLEDLPTKDSADMDEEMLFNAQLEEILYLIEQAETPEDLLDYYFELQYLSYITLREVDLRPVLSMEVYGTYNLERWFNNLIQRRRLLYETELCYVDTERYDYTINIVEEEELNDERMEYWGSSSSSEVLEEVIYLHFVITGESGKAYPPLMAVNSQQTVKMEPREDGSWQITMHYFPGAVRKFIRTAPLEYRDDDVVLQELYEEFAPYNDTTALSPPAGSQPYRGHYAVRYAESFTEEHNGEFYRVDDWNGNCQNFVSQCILYGFGGGDTFDAVANRFMDSEWYSGGGGGSLAWENVDFFWDYATSGNHMICQELAGPSGLRAGDVIQTRNRFTHEKEDPEDYNHTLLVMNSHTLLLAQNTPACYVYYSDLVNTAPRFIRPLYQ